MLQEDANELFGRMYESIDIQIAIESGQLKTLEDVLSAVKARSNAIQRELELAGAQMARSVSMEEFEQREKDVVQHMTLAGFDASGQAPN